MKVWISNYGYTIVWEGQYQCLVTFLVTRLVPRKWKTEKKAREEWIQSGGSGSGGGSGGSGGGGGSWKIVENEALYGNLMMTAP